jgi:hypothetical protein
MNALGRNAWLALGAAGLLAAACSQQGDRQAKQGQQGQSRTPASAMPPDASQPPGQQASRSAQGAPAQPGSQGAQPGAQGEKTVSGKVVRASGQELVLQPSSGAGSELKLKMSSSTPVTIDGRQGAAADLKEGAQVRASYQESGGAPTATKIEAQSSGSAGSSGSSGASGSQPAPGSSGQK